MIIKSLGTARDWVVEVVKNEESREVALRTMAVGTAALAYMPTVIGVSTTTAAITATVLCAHTVLRHTVGNRPVEGRWFSGKNIERLFSMREMNSLDLPLIAGVAGVTLFPAVSGTVSCSKVSFTASLIGSGRCVALLSLVAKSALNHLGAQILLRGVVTEVTEDVIAGVENLGLVTPLSDARTHCCSNMVSWVSYYVATYDSRVYMSRFDFMGWFYMGGERDTRENGEWLFDRSLLPETGIRTFCSLVAYTVEWLILK